jgi:hypothetical protein
MVVPEKPTSRALRGDLTPPQGFEPLLNSREAAALLRMHHKTLERWARRNQVPGYRYNGRGISAHQNWTRGFVRRLGNKRRRYGRFTVEGTEVFAIQLSF